MENRTSSPLGKNGKNKSRVNSTAGTNQFQVLRELLGDYSSSDNNSVGGDTVILESVFEGVVGDKAKRYPCVTNNDCIVYSRRRERGKVKVINEVGSCSSSLLGHGGVIAEDGESSDWVLDRIILFRKKMGLAIEGKEMELVSFLATLDSLNKSHQLGKEKGHEQEEGERALLDGDLC